ncbi:MAG: DUF4910 domain-containing protein [Bacteroidota bacterium]
MIELLESYFDRLWPICRSLTGDGVRESLAILQELVPMEIHEAPSGKEVFDWTVPPEWNIRDAYLLKPDGKKVANFKENNLHLLNYSVPIQAKMSFAELDQHLFTLPHLPNAIPYITSYYNRNWGFCLSHEAYETLPREGEYTVFIDSSLAPGHMTYGDLVLPGETDEEILFSTYVCHPSMANNELSGPLVQSFLYQQIAALPRRKYTYRFVFIPETIGAINYLFDHGTYMKEKTVAGYVITCIGNNAPFVYKRSKHQTSIADRAAEHVLKHQPEGHQVIEFAVGGSDERQYCSPGFNLPVGSITRSMYQTYPEYHTSLDNKDFISFEALWRSVEVYFDIVQTLEWNDHYVNTQPFCEPQLGKRGLYHKIGGQPNRKKSTRQMLHLLSFADGKRDLIEIADWRGEAALEYLPIIKILQEQALVISSRTPAQLPNDE